MSAGNFLNLLFTDPQQLSPGRKLKKKEAEKAEEFATGPRPNPLGADIVFFRNRSVRISAPWKLKRARKLKKKEAEKTEEFALGPRHNPLGAGIVFFRTCSVRTPAPLSN